MEDNLWGKRAPLYDKLEWVRQNEFLDFFGRSCGVQHSYNVLDLGCGTGIVSELLSQEVRLFVGIDNSSEMIQIAVKKTSPANGHTHCALQDAQFLAFREGVFDLVTARMSCHHVDDVARALREARRVLKPGGRFILCEGIPPDEEVKPRYEQIFALKEKRHTFLETDLVEHLSAAGYRNIQVAPYLMREVSLTNWLRNSATNGAAVDEIFRLHRDADEHFKKVYNLQIRGNDIVMDWKFLLVSGVK